ncbi:phosphate ABC transporter substrate-binding protein PstS [Candidatus Acetothermia bacterium]|nr:phosphate ABC transporter substrate-binding protein PstS [Candidatus Acetothermia bacterium]MBI3643574.1 phosphate ABC transporter substrate-binding protein PstS [Candidatus Acetothermia bacterium]
MKNIKRRFIATGFALLLLASVGLFSTAQGTVSLNGSGATFPAPIYTKWAQEFATQTGNIQVNYQPIGSGGGQSAIVSKTVDFAGSDAFCAATKCPAPIVHFPTVGGAVTLTYNLPDLGCVIKLTPLNLSRIFLGQIKSWRDAALLADNSTCNLPNSDIIVVHRSDGSGTTSIFTNYLSAISDDWKSQVGSGSSVSWPTDALGGLGGNGNAGVTQAVQQNKFSIGYVELIFALNNNLPVADVQNGQGQFVQPSLESTNTAIANITSIPDDFNISPLALNVNAPGAYPIVGPTYILVYQDLQNITDNAKAQALVDFLCWAVNSNGSSLGQDFANSLSYAKMPKNVTDEDNKRIKQVTFNGQPVNTSRYCP